MDSDALVLFWSTLVVASFWLFRQIRIQVKQVNFSRK